MTRQPLEFLEVQPDGAPDATVIWLHGLGDDGYGFRPITAELKLPPGMKIRFVFPHAPLRAITINGGLLMRGWYDIRSAELLADQDEEGIRRSEESLRGLIEDERARGMETGRIILAGFSQGGAIVLQTALRHPEPLGGIIALSCYLPLAAALEQEADPSNRKTPIFMAHGDYDPIIPSAAGRASLEKLRALGYEVEWRTYPMEHSVCLEEIDDLSAWLKKVLE